MSMYGTSHWIIDTHRSFEQCVSLMPCNVYIYYRESEDTALLILKEVYKTMGIHPEQIIH